MAVVQIRAIDFFKIAKAVGRPVDDVIKAWDGREFISIDTLSDYLRNWKDRIKNGTMVPFDATVIWTGKEI